MKKSPPGGFYLMTTSRSDQREAEENAMMCVAAHFTGLRWIDNGLNGRRKPSWCTKFESLTEASHYGQILCDKKKPTKGDEQDL